MTDKICLLITCFDGDQLLRCAVKVNYDELFDNYCMEPENIEVINKHLPEHCRYKIVEVMEIFDIVKD